jgi:hypothetical protein
MAHVQGGDCFCLRSLLSDESWRIALTQKTMEMDFCVVFCGNTVKSCLVSSQSNCAIHQNKCLPYNKYIYNIAFVNSERWLAKSRVDITQCQHGNVGKFLSLYFFVLYYKTNLKHFFRIDIQFGRRVSTQFLVFPISTRVDITLYQHGKCFI